MIYLFDPIAALEGLPAKLAPWDGCDLTDKQRAPINILHLHRAEDGLAVDYRIPALPLVAATHAKALIVLAKWRELYLQYCKSNTGNDQRAILEKIGETVAIPLAELRVRSYCYGSGGFEKKVEDVPLDIYSLVIWMWQASDEARRKESQPEVEPRALRPQPVQSPTAAGPDYLPHSAVAHQGDQS